MQRNTLAVGPNWFEQSLNSNVCIVTYFQREGFTYDTTSLGSFLFPDGWLAQRICGHPLVSLGLRTLLPVEDFAEFWPQKRAHGYSNVLWVDFSFLFGSARSRLSEE